MYAKKKFYNRFFALFLMYNFLKIMYTAAFLNLIQNFNVFRTNLSILTKSFFLALSVCVCLSAMVSEIYRTKNEF